MSAIIWPLLIYWLVLFVACFVVVEIGQDQLYDEVTPRAGLKVVGGSLLLAALLTALRVRTCRPRSTRCSRPILPGRCFKASSGLQSLP